MIIGVLGYEGSGKNTFARMLADKLDGGVYEVASPLKGMLTDLIGECKCSSVYYKTAIEKAEPISDQHMMRIKEGLKFLDRHIDSNFYHTLVPGPVIQDWKAGILDFLSTKRTYRELIQFVGTECMRGWNKYIHTIEVPSHLAFPVIISDIRFKNEMELCDHLVLIKRPSTDPANSHISSSGWMDQLKCFEHSIVFNSSDLETLDRQADKYLRLIGEL